MRNRAAPRIVAYLVLLAPVAGYEAQAAEIPAFDCKSEFATREAKIDADKERLNHLKYDSAEFKQVDSDTYHSQAGAAFLDIACDQNDKALHEAGDLLDQSPGEPVAFMIELLARVRQNDYRKVQEMYESEFKEVAVGPQPEDAYYHDLAFLLIRKTLCAQNQKIEMNNLCSDSTDLYFPKNMPVAIIKVLQKSASGRPVAATDFKGLPAPYIRAIKLLLYLNSSGMNEADKRLLVEFALDEANPPA